MILIFSPNCQHGVNMPLHFEMNDTRPMNSRYKSSGFPYTNRTQTESFVDIEAPIMINSICALLHILDVIQKSQMYTASSLVCNSFAVTVLGDTMKTGSKIKRSRQTFSNLAHFFLGRSPGRGGEGIASA